MSATVLAVHDDIAFLFALAVQLKRSRVNLIPAISVRNAERLLAELKLEPALLIINCKIKGVCAFATESQRRSPALKVVSIDSEGHHCLKCRYLISATIVGSQSQLTDRWADLVRALAHQSLTVSQ